MENVDEKQDANKWWSGKIAAFVFFLTLLLTGLIFTARASWEGSPAVALVWAFACLIVGNISGFLFGLPKVSAQDAPKDEDTQEKKIRLAREKAGLGINTNLEQVSDWLTKILVGLGLVEAKTLLGELRKAGEYIGGPLGTHGKEVATGMIVFFLGLGFISGYLLTRILLSPILQVADTETKGIAEKLNKTTAIAIDADEQSKSAPELYDVLDAAFGELMDSRKNAGAGNQGLPEDKARAFLKELERFKENSRWNLNRRLHIQLGVFNRRVGKLDEAIQILKEFVDRKKQAGQDDIHQAAALYNIACYEAVQARDLKKAGNPKAAASKNTEAMDHLERTVALSPSDGPEARQDNDFDEIWADERFLKLTAPSS
jgi:hypothetical protein